MKKLIMIACILFFSVYIPFEANAFEIPERTLPIKKMRMAKDIKIGKDEISIYEVCIDGIVNYVTISSNGAVALTPVIDTDDRIVHTKRCF